MLGQSFMRLRWRRLGHRSGADTRRYARAKRSPTVCCAIRPSAQSTVRGRTAAAAIATKPAFASKTGSSVPDPQVVAEAADKLTAELAGVLADSLRDKSSASCGRQTKRRRMPIVCKRTSSAAKRTPIDTNAARQGQRTARKSAQQRRETGSSQQGLAERPERSAKPDSAPSIHVELEEQ